MTSKRKGLTSNQLPEGPVIHVGTSTSDHTHAHARTHALIHAQYLNQSNTQSTLTDLVIPPVPSIPSSLPYPSLRCATLPSDWTLRPRDEVKVVKFWIRFTRPIQISILDHSWALKLFYLISGSSDSSDFLCVNYLTLTRPSSSVHPLIQQHNHNLYLQSQSQTSTLRSLSSHSPYILT